MIDVIELSRTKSVYIRHSSWFLHHAMQHQDDVIMACFSLSLLFLLYFGVAYYVSLNYSQNISQVSSYSISKSTIESSRKRASRIGVFVCVILTTNAKAM